MRGDDAVVVGAVQRPLTGSAEHVVAARPRRTVAAADAEGEAKLTRETKYLLHSTLQVWATGGLLYINLLCSKWVQRLSDFTLRVQGRAQDPAPIRITLRPISLALRLCMKRIFRSANHAMTRLCKETWMQRLRV